MLAKIHHTTPCAAVCPTKESCAMEPPSFLTRISTFPCWRSACAPTSTFISTRGGVRQRAPSGSPTHTFWELPWRLRNGFNTQKMHIDASYVQGLVGRPYFGFNECTQEQGCMMEERDTSSAANLSQSSAWSTSRVPWPTSSI